MGLLSDIYGGLTDAWNTKQQQEDRIYDMRMQQEAWRREDNAVQRRVADLKAAGLSPVLAAGSAASASSPIQASVPRFDASNMMRSVEMESARKQQAITEAQLDLVKAQTDEVQARSWPQIQLVSSLIKDASTEGRKSYDFITSMLDRAIAENKEVTNRANNYAEMAAARRKNGILPDSQNYDDYINNQGLLDSLFNGPLDLKKAGSLLMKTFRR